MLKFPKRAAVDFRLQLDEPAAEEKPAENKKEPRESQFRPPTSAEWMFENKASEFIVTLVEGEAPATKAEADAELEQIDQTERKTRRAILLSHDKVNPLEVPVADWVLHDGGALPFGTSKAILIHRATAKLMADHDVAYHIAPHPRVSGEPCIRAVYLCPPNTLETLNYTDNPKCAMCDNESVYRCRCQSVGFCSHVCETEAQRRGGHDDGECLRQYASRLVKRAQIEKDLAVERGRRAAQAQAGAADDNEDADRDDKDQ